MHSDCMHSDCMHCHAHHAHDARQGCKRLPSCRGSKRRAEGLSNGLSGVLKPSAVAVGAAAEKTTVATNDTYSHNSHTGDE